MASAQDPSRPNPDALLAQVKAEETNAARGKLKVFFGAAAGVGKTYAMLSAGRAKAMEDVDVVVGYAEPHARPETESILLGMEILPYRTVPYRDRDLREFDLDAALQRRPELLLVDELAHTNAPGSRHAKRWQDIEELLASGINVYTTLNVQHLESLNDVVAQITGVVVRETLPDALFERADEVELVDLSPDELLERMADGKVYMPSQAQLAATNFFRKPNLTALRELALRKTADRVSDQVQSARLQQFARKTWPTGERILVCISPSPSSAKVVRSAKRLAVSLHAQWIVAYVETPRHQSLNQKSRDRLQQFFRLAERLGAETVTLSGRHVADELVNYARSRNVTKIVAGKSDRPRWLEWLPGSLVDDLIRRSGEIDVYVIRGVASAEPVVTVPRQPQPIAWVSYGHACLVVLLCTLSAGIFYLGFRLHDRGDLSNLIMIYLVGVAAVAARHGRTPAALTALLSVATFDLLFVPPQFRLTVHDTQYFLTFGVMLSIGMLIATLTARLREQADSARQRERRTEALYRMTQELARATSLGNLCDVAVRHLDEVFQCQVAILLPDTGRRLHPHSAGATGVARQESEIAVAQWVFDNRRSAGHGTDTLPASACLYLPLLAAHGGVGVIGIQTPDVAHLLAPEQRHLLDAFTSQIALAIERDQLAQDARRAHVQAETEKMRSTLLSSVSHDLRTPLAVITGASSSLLQDSQGEPGARGELLRTIHDESHRLTRLVGNLLDMTRLESGAVTLTRQWHPLEEIVGSALHHLEPHLAGRRIKTELPADLPLVQVDGVLLEQVFINLLENALKYAPADQEIVVRAAARGEELIVEVWDGGPGLAEGEEARVFEKFYRGAAATPQRGSGLGLAICRAIIAAHGGTITAENRRALDGQHGAVFRFRLTLEKVPPALSPLIIGTS